MTAAHLQHARTFHGLAASSRGAFDLPSIITGTVVVGVLTAGVLASIFGVIPFAQDNGARQDAAAVRTAEATARAKNGRFMDTAGLIAAGYLPAQDAAAASPGAYGFERAAAVSREKVAAAVDATGTCFVAVSRSETGKSFFVTDTVADPAALTPVTVTGCLEATSVQTLVDSVGGYPASYIPAAPSGVTGTVTSPTTASFTWPVVDMAAGYKVESRVGAASWAVLSENQTGTSATVTAGANDTITIRVTALNPAGASGASQDVSVQLPADPVFKTLTVTKMAGTATWRSIASSADGQKLIAGRNDDNSLYTSTNGGSSWTKNNPLGNTGSWESVASSSDGTHLFAALYGDSSTHMGMLFASSDSGKTWVQRFHSGTNWSNTASSGDGRILFAANHYSYMAAISTDYGATWRELYVGPSGKYIQEAAISTDGSIMMAGTSSALFISKDQGATWTEQTQVGAGNWSGMAASADGSVLIAGASSPAGYLYVSHDRGATWTKHDELPATTWSGMAASADGTKLAASGSAGKFYTSTDSGATWKLQAGFGSSSFRDVVSSADGKKIIADQYAGPIYIGTYGP